MPQILLKKKLCRWCPVITSESIVSGLAGVFSGFSKHVKRISGEYSVDQRDVYFELGKRKVVAGQEDLIIEVVLDLVKKINNDAGNYGSVKG